MNNAALQRDDRDEQILSLRPLVEKAARRVAMSQLIELDDARSYAWLGAIHAIDSFEADRGVPLSIYAWRVIFGRALNGKRSFSQGGMSRRAYRKGELLREQIRADDGREPTSSEINDRIPGYDRACAHGAGPLSLDAPFDWSVVGEPPPGGVDPCEVVIAHEGVKALHAAIAALPANRAAIVERHYLSEESLRRIAEEFDVSPQRVSQIHLDALKRLRASVRNA
jgi:RNA polymerase sigma factor for flagellar operon FliA